VVHQHVDEDVVHVVDERWRLRPDHLEALPERLFRPRRRLLGPVGLPCRIVSRRRPPNPSCGCAR
jgi:hypothetical protein